MPLCAHLKDEESPMPRFISPMTWLRNSALALGLCAATSPAGATDFEIRNGFDLLSKDQSIVTGFHHIAMLRPIGGGVFFGQSIYSSATGDGGGLFVGGIELIKRVRLGEHSALEIGGFLGGGGGASVVAKDGLMSRAQLTYRRQLNERWSGYAGVSYIDITGSPISSSALTFGISNTPGFALAGSGAPLQFAPTDLRLRAVKPQIKAYIPNNNRRTTGGMLDTMQLLGAEFTFTTPANQTRETYFSMMGAVAGDGAGYAEWQLGRRWFHAPGGPRLFGEIGAGFAGGGQVATGGGFVVSAGGGVAIPITDAFEMEIGATAIGAPDGDFLAAAPFVRGSILLGDVGKRQKDGRSQRWQLSTGLTQHRAHPGFRLPGANRPESPMLLVTSLDMFIGDRTYITGSGQTVVGGNAGGYAAGQFGLGYAMPLSDRWTLSTEAYVGAAAGGSVNSGGGLVGGGRLELDYALNERLWLSGSIGKMVSRGDARPTTVHLGLKIPFETLH